ncbi:MobA/MobL family protein [Aureimonas sp. AU12]|uniref:MobA/MobL family protein n=1 Tax=Aureimonas sp. AU12 TaxID=1638161 RepID=UPI0009E92481|nr:MobA/MobL family protein [Aureimonas sp. AU12]
MTSLPAHEALCHVCAKVVQRSRGRSAVAAAAYRSGTRLVDARTGSAWDYSRKRHVTDSFVMVPDGAPAWTRDRESLWSRAELAERRKDSVTAREVEVSIPRDLPDDRWADFLRDVAAPYVATGAVVDVAIHCPPAGDRERQPHGHILMTMRALDPSTGTGFAAVRNADLLAIFESGGRAGGRKGDALVRERERVAGVLNAHLRGAGSRRRADHRSYAARGDPRVPEPLIGERRKACVVKRRKHDRRTAVVAGLRESRQLDNELVRTEMDMALKARGFPRAPDRKQRSGDAQDYKVALLKERFPDADVSAFGGSLYMVDVRNTRATRVLLKDGAWVEADDESGTVSLWGPRSAQAAALANVIAVSTGYGVDPLPRTARAGKPGRARRRQAVAEVEAVALADRWRRRGFHDVGESPAGVRVAVGPRSRLLDSGKHVDLVGPVTDEALRALATKAAEDWSGSLELDGPWPEEARARLWLECQRQGVTLAGYEPSPECAAAWQAESATIADSTTKLRAVRSEVREADLVLAAAAGDVAALRRLDPPLRAFVAGHLDDDQRAELAKSDREDVTASLPAFRQLGRVELERDPKSATVVAQPEPLAPRDGYERRPG